MAEHLCAKCGVVRAVRKAKCACCGHAYDEPLTADLRVGGAYWVCLACTFKCRACGFAAPLGHLDMDGSVVCARCGLEQAFEVVRWWEALRHAHAIGDLWNEPDSRPPEYANVGETKSSVELELEGDNRLVVVASPGRPLCATCHGFLEIDQASRNDARATVRCACGDATYELPAKAHKGEPALVTIVAPEHRVDRAPVKVDESASAIAIRCPSCGGPLEVGAATKFVSCDFCKTVSRIPDRVWVRLSKSAPESAPMWLLFDGPSRLRSDVEDRRRSEAETKRRRELAAAEKEERQNRAREAKERVELERRQEQERETRLQREEEERREALQREAEKKRGRVLVVLLVAMVIGVVVIYALARGR